MYLFENKWRIEGKVVYTWNSFEETLGFRPLMLRGVSLTTLFSICCMSLLHPKLRSLSPLKRYKKIVWLVLHGRVNSFGLVFKETLPLCCFRSGVFFANVRLRISIICCGIASFLSLLGFGGGISLDYVWLRTETFLLWWRMCFWIHHFALRAKSCGMQVSLPFCRIWLEPE